MTKLHEFDPEVLRAMLNAVILKSKTLNDHIARIESHGPDLRRLMAESLIGFRKEVCLLETAEIQLSTAIAMQSMDSKAHLN